MVTCFFMGHSNLYDLELYPNILKAIKKVVAQDNDIEFVFDKQTTFNVLCLEAILEVRQSHPEKKLKLTYITRQDVDNEWLQSIHRSDFPFYVFDKIIRRPDLSCDMRRAPIEWRHEARTLINHSDFLICYEYLDLRDSYYELYERALRRADLTVINVAAQETAQAIIESMDRLETEQQYFIGALKAHKSYKTIGEEFGVSGGAIRCKDLAARRLLRTYAQQRYKRLRQSAGHSPTPPRSCSIVLPTKMDQEDEKRFRETIYFMVKYLGVTSFLVEQMNRNSEFVSYLLKLRAVLSFRVVLATHFSDSVATTWGSTSEGFVPPFDEVINIDPHTEQLRAKHGRTLSAMLDRSKFVICKSMIDSDPATFRQIQKHKGLRVFNLGHSQERIMLQNQ